jgi:asparagine synthase (glutamine-hydrolysing)
MFALALWDRQERTLQLARDRMGEKPLFYGWSRDRFLFASELGAFHALPAFDAPVDRDALGLYLCHGYVPAPWTIHQGVRKLRPGELLTLSMRTAMVEEAARRELYWSIGDALAAPRFSGSCEEAVEELETRLSQAVRLQMVADVPLGAFLSGGVDSSTIVALMQSTHGRPVKTFSIGFEEPAYNEAPQAAAVAASLATDHTELVVTSDDALAVVPELASVWDEPFADSSQIPTLLLARLARRQVTVSLSGDGGDELFWGYDHYRLARRLQRLPGLKLMGAMLNRASPELIAQVARHLPPPLRKSVSAERAMVLRDYADAKTLQQRIEALHLRPRQNLAFLAGAPECAYPLIDLAVPDGLDLDTAASVIDAGLYLPDDIMVKVDRASMSVGLEARAPMLDHRVVEFAFSLPLSYKFRDGQTKWPLRRLLYRRVPRNLVERPKMGFGGPISSWLRGPLRAWADDLLSPAALQRDGYLASAAVTSAWQAHKAGRRDQGARLWRLLMFRAWQAHHAGRSAVLPSRTAAVRSIDQAREPTA